MKTIAIETAFLVGPALDWAVAAAEGLDVFILPPVYGTGPRVFIRHAGRGVRWWPSMDWSQIGPLIEAYRIQLLPGTWWEAQTDLKRGPAGWFTATAGTAPVAACRAIVSARLGDVVNVPVAACQPMPTNPAPVRSPAPVN